MIGRARESRNPKKVIRVTLMESYGEIGRMPVNLCFTVLNMQNQVDGDYEKKSVKIISSNEL